jgi:hypothetical protein
MRNPVSHVRVPHLQGQHVSLEVNPAGEVMAVQVDAQA